MTITCSPNLTRGTMAILGSDIPNGNALLTRKTPGNNPYILRDGAFTVTTGGFRKDDSEPPYGVPLKYQLTMTLDTATRFIQSNRMLTPTFLHGLQGWVAGTGRTVDIQADPTAHSAQVGHFSGNPAGAAPVDPPTLVGHIESGYIVMGPYTLTPPTTGTTPIATGDWVFIFHQQRGAEPAPTTPVGFELVWSLTYTTLRTYVWRRKRQAGDTGYTVPAAANAGSVGTALWVRNASDTDPIIVGMPVTTQGTTLVEIPAITRSRPTLTLSFSAANTNSNVNPPATAAVVGATLQYVQGQGTQPRTTVVAAFSNTNAGLTPVTRITYNDILTVGVGIQIGIQAASPTAPRIIAKAKAGVLTASDLPYLMTGRFKFNSSDLFIWQDVYNNYASWADVKAKTWGEIRGATSGEGTSYIRFFVGIIDPVVGTYYVDPVQVITVQPTLMNTWTDFSFYFTTPVDIPTTAEVRFLHGTNLREYAVEWWFDELGITPGRDSSARNNVYWFDGDTTPPANSEDYLLPGYQWDDVSKDSYMIWSGAVGNSVSFWYGPSTVTTSTTCALTVPDGEQYRCSPVLLNDPVSPSRGQWFSLIDIQPLNYAARQTLYTIINRAPVTAVSQVRAWASGEFTLLTTTLADRSMALTVLETGRILLFRNPDRAFPENDWYLAIGDVQEARLGPDLRRPERLWTVPWARVERPSGLIDSQSGRTWQNVYDDDASWLATRTKNEDWLAVLGP